MEELLSGAVVTLVATIGVLGFFFLRTMGVHVQVLPLGDGFVHEGATCECMPQVLLSFGRTYVLHHDLRDHATDLQFDLT